MKDEISCSAPLCDRRATTRPEREASPFQSRSTPIWLTLFLLALCWLSGCREPDPTPTLTLAPTLTPSATATATATATPTPTPTPTATPTPTPTPIPPLYLTIEFPRPVTALEPVPIRVLIEEPAGIDTRLRVSARVIDAQDQLYTTFEMARAGQEGWWSADEMLQLPLEPEPYPGVWHLIIDAEAALPIKGYRDRVFTPQRVPYHVLTDTLPLRAELRVPQAFTEVAAQGDPVAGLRTWRYRDCEITLAWAPGPTERLFGDNALVMAEALYDPQHEISVETSEELVWEEWAAFLFYELWGGSKKSTPAETLVVQGPNYQLYALRIRAQSQDKIHPLCRDVRATLGFKK